MNAAAATVLVSLGTDHHRFDRLIDWVDHWVAAHPGRANCVAQVGTSKASATGASHSLMSPEGLSAEMAAAAAVVCHGGPGTIMDARRAGVEPIVVPRSGRRGEHVDDHQERFARWMAGRGQVLVASEEVDLHRLLDRVLDDPRAYRRPGRHTDVAHVARTFGELVDGLMGER